MIIAIAADANFEKQLSALLVSLHQTQDKVERILVLQSGIDAGGRNRATQCMPSHVEWISVTPEDFGHIKLPPYLPVTTVFRLLLPYLLPADVDRVIYLDADIVVRRSLDALWATDLGTDSTGAVRDALVPCVGCPGGLPWQQFGLDPRQRYFNAGVLLIDVSRWRDEGIGKSALEILSQHRFPYGDQCALNIVLEDKVRALEPTWNMQSGHFLPAQSLAWTVENEAELRASMLDPHIVHFNTSPLGRPWLSSCSHPFREEWFTALDASAWRDWRPRRWAELRAKLHNRSGRAALVRRARAVANAAIHG